MRTWLLAPDGVWAEVTDRVRGYGSVPGCWPWKDLVAGIGEAVEIGDPVLVDHTTIAQTHAQISDRWMAQRVWDVLCSPRIDRVSTVHVVPDGHVAWLAALRTFTGCHGTEPNHAWLDRRTRWLLWAHSDSDTTPELDGAHIVVGAARVP